MGRLASLDGLRGLASLAVVFTHVMLTSELFAGAALRGEMNAVPGSWEWMVTYTPLHLFWDGTAAVAIFFVLSGLVLTLPVLRFGAGKFSWRAYYPKRVLRLYLPVWGAVLFGTLLAVVVPRVNHSSVGSWLGSRPDPTPLGALEDAILIFGPSDVISPLWTLQWEVLFSLLLPAYIAYSVLLPQWWILKLVAVVALIGVGVGTGMEPVVYMATFALGSLFAAELTRIQAAALRIRPAVWILLGVVGTLLLTSRWFLLALEGQEWMLQLARVLVILAAGFIVLLAAFWPRGAQLLGSRPVAALGTISFSLYLVHEPIVLATSYALGTPFSWLAVPLSILSAIVFYRFIERPSHQISTAVGRRVSRGRLVHVQPPSRSAPLLHPAPDAGVSAAHEKAAIPTAGG